MVLSNNAIRSGATTPVDIVANPVSIAVAAVKVFIVEPGS